MTSTVSCGFARAGDVRAHARWFSSSCSCSPSPLLLNQTQRLLFCYFLCSGVERVQVEGWARVEKAPQSSPLFVLFRYYSHCCFVCAQAGEEPWNPALKAVVPGSPPAPWILSAFFWASVSAPNPSPGGEFSLFWSRRKISGPDVQLVPFDLSSADISAFGRWMLRLPGRWVSSVLESSPTPWNLTWKNQHGHKTTVADVCLKQGHRLIMGEAETNN